MATFEVCGSLLYDKYLSQAPVSKKEKGGVINFRQKTGISLQKREER
jgi:hypothetical protein